ncbi:protein ycf72, partial [Musa troglodytarum]
SPCITSHNHSQHLDPDLPKPFLFTPTLPTYLIIVKQFLGIKWTSPNRNLNVADLHSFAINFTTTLVALANCPPFLCVIFMLSMVVPKGISIEVSFTTNLYQTMKHSKEWSSIIDGIINDLRNIFQ